MKNIKNFSKDIIIYRLQCALGSRNPPWLQFRDIYLHFLWRNLCNSQWFSTAELYFDLYASSGVLSNVSTLRQSTEHAKQRQTTSLQLDSLPYHRSKVNMSIHKRFSISFEFLQLVFGDSHRVQSNCFNSIDRKHGYNVKWCLSFRFGNYIAMFIYVFFFRCEN